MLLEVAMKWIFVVSNECSTLPGTSSGTSNGPYKDPPFKLLGKLNDYVLEQIVTVVNKMPLDGVEYAIQKESAAKRDISVKPVM